MYIKLYIHSMHMPLSHILNRGKVWWEESLANLPFSSIWRKVWQISRSAKRLLIVRTNLVWQVTDNSPNSTNIPLPNFHTIR